MISKVIGEFLSLSCRTFADGFLKVPAWHSLTPVSWPKASGLCPAASHVAHVCYMETRDPAGSTASQCASRMTQRRLQTKGNKATVQILLQMCSLLLFFWAGKGTSWHGSVNKFWK